MSEWSGFSDEALKKLTTSKENPRSIKQSGKMGARKVMTAKSIVPGQQVKLNNYQKLSAPKEIVKNDSNNLKIQNEKDISKVSLKESSTGTGAQESPSTSKGKHDEPFKSKLENDLKTIIIDDSTFHEKEKVTIDNFRDRQKEIEELNKRKRVMLTNAISEKVKRTKEEGQKLVMIKKELEVLDQMVASDVSIVRDRIEEVTRNYAISQRRYELAEAEFIVSKIELHERSELKEQLTEHLYTIIHQNELRKAHKLDQLTSQLDSNSLHDLSSLHITESPIIPSTLTSTICQPDIQKFRHKLQAGLDGLAENKAELAKCRKLEECEIVKEAVVGKESDKNNKSDKIEKDDKVAERDKLKDDDKLKGSDIVENSVKDSDVVKNKDADEVKKRESQMDLDGKVLEES